MSNRDRPLLAPATVLYLVLPGVGFAYGWLRPAYAAVSIALLVCSIIILVIDIARAVGSPQARQALRDFGESRLAIFRVAAPASLLVLAWLLLSGAGGFGFQNSDYSASNALLRDLIVQDWPLTITLNGVPTGLVYYVGYYLPAALVGKVWGWGIANIAIFIWTGVGCYLSLAWFLRLSRVQIRKSSGRLLCLATIFCLAGGLDLLGYYGVQKQAFSLTQHIEPWAVFFQYSSHTTLLYWVPQQAIAAWLTVGVIAGASNQPSTARYIGITIASALLWSPFGVVGALPFVLVALPYRVHRENRRMVGDVSSVVLGVAGVWIGAVTLLYLSANQYSFPMGFLWTLTSSKLALLKSMLVFWCLEFAALAALIAILLTWQWRSRFPRGMQYPARRALGFREHLSLCFDVSPRQLLCFMVSLGILFVLPFFKMGIQNDLVMRASIPALFVFWAFVSKIVMDMDNLVRRRLVLLYAAILFVVGLGFFPAIAEISRSTNHYHFGPSALATVIGTGEANDLLTVKQRAGRQDSVFFHYIGK